MKRKLLMLAALAAQSFAVLQAQDIGPSILNSAGGGGTLSGNSYDWSVGEMALISTFTSSNLVVTQGLLQPTSGTTSINDVLLPASALAVYPNPASDVVYLKPLLKTGDKLNWYLTDITGKVVVNQGVILQTGSDIQTLQFAQLAAGNYLLHVAVVSGDNRYNNNYKIQKVK